MIRSFAKTLGAALAASLFLSACDESSTGPEKSGTTRPPLLKWTFSGSEIAYKSGIATRKRDAEGKVVPGLTVWLTDQSIDCTAHAEQLPVLHGGWLGIKFPETGLGNKTVRVVVGNWPDGPGINGNIDAQGTAELDKADLTGEKTVSGSLDFHGEAFDPEDDFGKADVSGSFSVPYCPEA